MQYYDYEKRVIDWTDSHVCDEDEVYYEFFIANSFHTSQQQMKIMS